MQFKGHEDRVESVQLRLSGVGDPLMGVVVSASRDSTLKYWDIKRYYVVVYTLISCTPGSCTVLLVNFNH